jgi:phosphoribosylformylglycinamidine synthase
VHPSDIRIAILRIEGTNCEEESYRAFAELGARPEYVHLNMFSRGDASLFDYQGVFIPGGFSAGDYVRAGAIFAARIKALLMEELRSFVDDGYPVVGICNGFQVLTELGLLPGLDGVSMTPEACLAVNDSNRFECRPTLLRHDHACPLTARIPEGDIRLIPSAHMEGKLMLPQGREQRIVERLEDEGCIVFRYVDDRGTLEGYPWNPNGSIGNIAGLCTPAGNVLGMMPHPERSFNSWQHQADGVAGGRALFESMLDYIGML